MKLRAPDGVGDPCVAGVAIVPRDGVYEVEPQVGALLIECFSFVEVETAAKLGGSAGAIRRGKIPSKRASRES